MCFSQGILGQTTFGLVAKGLQVKSYNLRDCLINSPVFSLVLLFLLSMNHTSNIKVLKIYLKYHNDKMI